MAPVILVRFEGEAAELRFEYDATFVERVKRIPGRKWDGDKKCWLIPKANAQLLTREFEEKQLAWETSPPWNPCRLKVINPIEKLSVDLSVQDELHVEPYPFQWVGANYLASLDGAMLADEMGLGKSLQAMAGFLLLKRRGKARKALILCPASLKLQWQNEMRKFTDLSVLCLNGGPEKRTRLYKLAARDFIDCFIVNYELLRFDLENIQALMPKVDVIITDEAQRLKNCETKTYELVQSLQPRYKWELTGTPVENTVDDAYNLVNYIQPGLLGPHWKFAQEHVVYGRHRNVIGSKNRDVLHAKLSPFILRRTKKEVGLELPEVIMQTVRVAMTDFQAKAHELIRTELAELIRERMLEVPDEDLDLEGKTDDESGRGRILGLFSHLLAVADAPGLLEQSESRVAKHFLKELKPKKADLKSPKLEYVTNAIEERLQSNPSDKIVIFTRFERMQHLITEALRALKSVECKVVELNGGMTAKKRDKAQQDFVEGDANVFVSTDAGAFGLNLQVASMLINFDLPWNPAVFNQRNGRIHRIGSKHQQVHIVSLIAEKSVDERVYTVLYNKQLVFDQVIEKSEVESAAVQKISMGLMARLLKRERPKPWQEERSS